MNASWYDLLDVEPDATEAEIKTAWKAAIADLDPTDRTFRVYNQAAGVLLDPAKRTAYDAQLAAEAEAEGPEPVEETDASATPAAPTAVEDLRKPKQARQPKGSTTATGSAATGPASAGRRGQVPGWLLVAVAAVTALAVGACAWLWFERPSDATVEDSTRTAQSAAERAIVPILSYNALHLDEDQQAAASYMTSAYRKQYDQLFAVIKQNAPETKTIVKAEVLASGVVRSGESRVDVLLFVNRPTTNKQQTEPVVYKDQVTVTMEKVDGDWLVDDLVTSPVGK